MAYPPTIERGNANTRESCFLTSQEGDAAVPIYERVKGRKRSLPSEPLRRHEKKRERSAFPGEIATSAALSGEPPRHGRSRGRAGTAEERRKKESSRFE